MDVRGGMKGEGNEDKDGDDGEYVPRRNPPLEEPSDDVQQLHEGRHPSGAPTTIGASLKATWFHDTV